MPKIVDELKELTKKAKLHNLVQMKEYLRIAAVKRSEKILYE